MKNLLALVCLSILFVSAAPGPPGTTYYSIKDGLFEGNDFWSKVSHTDPTCGCNPGCTITGNNDIIIEHGMTSACNNLDLSGNATITVKSGGTLSIAGGVDVSGSAGITVENGGELTVLGDFTASGNSNVNIDGEMTATGDVSATGSANICGTGAIQHGGTVSGLCAFVSTVFSGSAVDLIYSNNDGASKDDNTRVFWSTDVEMADAFFTIERSQNGVTFEEIGYLNGSGNGDTELDYEFTDPDPLPGTAYYRFKRTDSNGDDHYSNLAAVNNLPDNSDFSTECVIQVNPNPCNGNCQLMMNNCPDNADAPVKITLLDASGNVVDTYVQRANFNGSFNMSIDKSNNLKPGVYIVMGASDSDTKSTKFIMN